MMMVGNWGQHVFINTAHKNDGLANVRLDGKERSDADVIAMLESRVQPIRVEEWVAMAPRSA